MALIKSVRGFTPQIGENCYLADNATIIGDVIMGHDCSIWFNAVLRGDVNAIRIGNRVNIQDGSVLHTLYQKSVVEIGYPDIEYALVKITDNLIFDFEVYHPL
jgi:carbonic anhydrase/acetyltransferase-like protein (isoleucine patch superfamily)